MSGAGEALARLYAILDAETLARLDLDLVVTALTLERAGVRLFQYRDKRGDRASFVKDAMRLSATIAGSGCLLVLNDYPDRVDECGFGGVHVGQGDGDPSRAREVIGRSRVLGVSTHNEVQMRLAAAGPADYVAIGPVFPTGSKADAEPAIGLGGVRRARGLTTKPMVAIGGITASNARSVIEAGADSVAVIGGLFHRGVPVHDAAQKLLDVLSE